MINKREHILLTSEELFSELGFEGTSVRAIAAKAKVNIAMISYYFGSKEKLFEALVDYRTSFLYDRYLEIKKTQDDPLKRIEEVAELTVDRILSNPKFHKVIHRQIGLQQRSQLSQHLVSNLLKNMFQIKKMINDGIKRKIFRKIDVDLFIISLFSTTSQLAHSSLLCTRMLGTTGKPDPENKKLRQRLKTYLKDLMKNYLVIPK